MALNKLFNILHRNSGRLSQPMHWADWVKDKACKIYIEEHGLDSLRNDIYEQLDDKTIIRTYESNHVLKDIIYSCLEQKLIELVDQYNDELDNDEPIDPMDAAGHTDRDFF